jgi:hypothetical protein
MALTTDEQDDDTDSQDSTDGPSRNVLSSPNTSDISSLFGQANQDLQSARSQGLTRDQLDTLSKHEGASSLASMFMNMIGAANNVSAKPFIDTLNQSTQNQQKNLEMQDLMANRGIERAQAEQNLGMNQLKGNELLNEQQILNLPIDNTKKGLLLAYNRINKTGEPIDPNMTQRQYQQVIPDIEKLAQINAQQARLAQQRENEGWHTVQRPDGSSFLKNVLTGKEIDAGAPTAADANKTYQLPDLIAPNSPLGKSQLQDVKANIPKIQNEASKLLTEENDYNNNVSSLKMMINEARNNGNYIAANNLSAREAQTFDNMKQKLSNMVLQMQNNGMRGGPINAAQTFLNEVEGKGKVTYSDAKNMLDLSDKVSDLKKQYYDKQKEDLRNKTRTHIPSNVNADIDSLTFGRPNPTNGNNQMNGGAPVSNYMKASDFLNSIGAK